MHGWGKAIGAGCGNITTHNTPISIVVAYRNEAKNLEGLLQSLRNIQYENTEIILVNDDSEDGSQLMVKTLTEEFTHKVLLLDLPKGESGKKAALRLAGRHATGEYLLFTDADCRFGARWPEHMLDCAISQDADLVSGTVLFEIKKGFFNNLMRLEFLSLIATGAAAIGLNRPSLCNGANLLIKRDAFTANNNTKGNQRSSGDDVFLLHAVKKTGTIVFNAAPEAIVYTRAPESPAEFIAQRVRWASKTGSYSDMHSIVTAAIVLLCNMAILMFFVAALITPHTGYFFAGILIAKFSVDALLLRLALQHYGIGNMFINIPALSILYPFYVLGIALLSVFYKPRWKGRVIR